MRNRMPNALSSECTANDRFHLRVHGQPYLHEIGSVVYAVCPSRIFLYNCSYLTHPPQVLPLPSRPDPHRLPHDRLLKPRCPKLATGHRNHQSPPNSPVIWQQSICLPVLRSDRPTLGLAIRYDVWLVPRRPTSKCAAAGLPAAIPTGIYAIPRAAV